MLIRQNLFDFILVASKLDRDTLFWVDAVCINQDNLFERNSQVARMGEIYECAQDVRIWLGDNPYIAEILSTISKLSAKTKHLSGECGCLSIYAEPDRFETEDRLPRLPDELHFPTCPFRLEIARLFENDCPIEYAEIFEPERRKALLQNEYWSRTWIIQEILLAEKVLIQSGTSTTDLSHIIDLHCRSLQDISPHMQRILGNIYDKGPLALGIPKRDFELLEMLNIFEMSSCFETLDHVYGLRALVKGGDKIDVDYRKTPAVLFIDMIRVFELDDNDVGESALLLYALGLHPERLVQGLPTSVFWSVQKVLSSSVFSRILSASGIPENYFPMCKKSSEGSCEWSSTGRGIPCSQCQGVGARIAKHEFCADNWDPELRRLAKENSKPWTDPQWLRNHFKHWISEIWPNELEGLCTELDERGEILFEDEIPENTLTLSEAFAQAFNQQEI